MAEEFNNDNLKKVVAQICQQAGFDGIMTTPLLVLSDLLKRFISDVGRKSQQYSEHCGRTTPTLTDLELALRDQPIDPEELYEFLTRVVPHPESLPKFPVDERLFDTRTIQESTNAHLLHTYLPENSIAIKMNPLLESDNLKESSNVILEPIEDVNMNIPKETLNDYSNLKIPEEHLEVEAPKESLKLKISLKGINPSSKKKGIKKNKSKKKKGIKKNKSKKKKGIKKNKSKKKKNTSKN